MGPSHLSQEFFYFVRPLPSSAHFFFCGRDSRVSNGIKIDGKPLPTVNVSVCCRPLDGPFQHVAHRVLPRANGVDCCVETTPLAVVLGCLLAKGIKIIEVSRSNTPGAAQLAKLHDVTGLKEDLASPANFLFCRMLNVLAVCLLPIHSSLLWLCFHRSISAVLPPECVRPFLCEPRAIGLQPPMRRRCSVRFRPCA